MKSLRRIFVAVFLIGWTAFFIGCGQGSVESDQAPPAVQSSSKQVQPQTIYVHITKTGKKYHVAGCRYLSHSDIVVTLEEAKARGLTPCSICNPPQ